MNFSPLLLILLLPPATTPRYFNNLPSVHWFSVLFYTNYNLSYNEACTMLHSTCKPELRYLYCTINIVFESLYCLLKRWGIEFIYLEESNPLPCYSTWAEL